MIFQNSYEFSVTYMNRVLKYYRTQKHRNIINLKSIGFDSNFNIYFEDGRETAGICYVDRIHIDIRFPKMNIVLIHELTHLYQNYFQHRPIINLLSFDEYLSDDKEIEASKNEIRYLLETCQNVDWEIPRYKNIKVNYE